MVSRVNMVSMVNRTRKVTRKSCGGEEGGRVTCKGHPRTLPGAAKMEKRGNQEVFGCLGGDTLDQMIKWV